MAKLTASQKSYILQSRPDVAADKYYSKNVEEWYNKYGAGEGQALSAPAAAPAQQQQPTYSEPTYQAKTYSKEDFLDTSGLEKAYGEAKTVYMDQLTALKPRYEELYKQLEAEKQLATEKEGVLSAEEQAQQKVNIAKRGIAVDEGNQFYTTEKGKLQEQQNLRSKETALQFAGKRLDISGAESADTRDITTAIANLDLNKANSIQGLIESAKQMTLQANEYEQSRAFTSSESAKQRTFAAQQAEIDRAFQAGENDKARKLQEKLENDRMEYQKARDKTTDKYTAKRDAVADAVTQRAFEYTKSKDAADLALRYYEANKEDAYRTTKDEAISSAIGALVSTAYLNPTSRSRESIQRELEISYPNKKAEIATAMEKAFPDNWESMYGFKAQVGVANGKLQINVPNK